MSPTKSFIIHLVNETKSLRLYIFAAILVIFCSYFLYNQLDVTSLIRLGNENEFFELATAICFVTGSFIFFRLFSIQKNIFFILLGICLFLGAGEELSWGQHLFNFNTPKLIEANNVQKEFNIHNLEIFNTDKFDNSRKTGTERFLEINFLFRLFCLTYGFLLPVLVFYFKPIKKFTEKVKLDIPPATIGSLFITNWLVYKLTLLLTKKNHPIAYYETSTEMYEFIASFIFLLLGIYFYRKNIPARKKSVLL
ncbi:MAG: hypothetical protein FGM46_05820 [Ferruginibacter sp.]|nr:hypothetical protein [Ferruginibacter sp.]